VSYVQMCHIEQKNNYLRLENIFKVFMALDFIDYIKVSTTKGLASI
jgi:hypothetical protein